MTGADVLGLGVFVSLGRWCIGGTMLNSYYFEGKSSTTKMLVHRTTSLRRIVEG